MHVVIVNLLHVYGLKSWQTCPEIEKIILFEVLGFDILSHQMLATCTY